LSAIVPPEINWKAHLGCNAKRKSDGGKNCAALILLGLKLRGKILNNENVLQLRAILLNDSGGGASSLPASASKSLHCPSSSEQMRYKRNDGEEEQQMNQAARNMEHQEATSPQNDQ
jgi:hypothetical protein